MGDQERPIQLIGKRKDLESIGEFRRRVFQATSKIETTEKPKGSAGADEVYSARFAGANPTFMEALSYSFQGRDLLEGKIRVESRVGDVYQVDATLEIGEPDYTAEFSTPPERVYSEANSRPLQHLEEKKATFWIPNAGRNDVKRILGMEPMFRRKRYISTDTESVANLLENNSEEFGHMNTHSPVNRDRNPTSALKQGQVAPGLRELDENVSLRVYENESGSVSVRGETGIPAEPGLVFRGSLGITGHELKKELDTINGYHSYAVR